MHLQSTQYNPVCEKENSIGSSSTFRQWYISGMRVRINRSGFCADLQSNRNGELAQGDVMMLGAYIGLTLVNSFELPYLWAVPATAFLMILLGAILERVFLDP